MAEEKLNSFMSQGGRLSFPEPAHPLVSVVVVVYNQPGLTLLCLESLAAEADGQVETVIVDNASEARTRELLTRVDGARVLYQAENLHFIRGVNSALPVLRGRYVLLLNNDVVVGPGALKHVLGVAEACKDVGAVGARVLGIDDQLLEEGCEILKGGICRTLSRGHTPQSPSPADRLREVDYVSGCFLLTRRSLLNEVGGLDERYAPAYLDDADYCSWLWDHGHRVICDLAAEVTHFESAGSNRDEIAKLVVRNQRIFRRKHRWRSSSQARMRFRHRLGS